VKVPTIDGAVQLKVPERTQSGGVLRLRGKGIARNSLLLWMEKPVFSLNAPLTLSGHQRLRFHR